MKISLDAEPEGKYVEDMNYLNTPDNGGYFKAAAIVSDRIRVSDAYINGRAVAIERAATIVANNRERLRELGGITNIIRRVIAELDTPGIDDPSMGSSVWKWTPRSVLRDSASDLRVALQLRNRGEF